MTATTQYHDFIRGKTRTQPPQGIDTHLTTPHLSDWQTTITEWALRRGRAALFEDTGLGKTRQQLVWADEVARHTDGRVLILAPLGVVQQTVVEAERIGVEATASRDGRAHRITVANYERLHKFNASDFVGVVLDESSRIKNFDSKTRDFVIGAFHDTPYKLACTATPAPNDHMELGNHAEFLNVMTRAEMLAMYFVHDGARTSQWRLKGHAQRDFWHWMSTWAVAIKHPRDLGSDAQGYSLPELRVIEHIIPSAFTNDTLFGVASGLREERDARRQNLTARVEATAAIVTAEPAEAWVVWCELNDESTALTAAIPGAVELAGSDAIEDKEAKLDAFTRGETRVLVTKASIAAHGLNWQHCARTAFNGVGHSFEQYYQAIRRFHRFGQTRPVHAHLVYAESDLGIRENLRRKELEAESMSENMLALMTPHMDATLRTHHADTTRVEQVEMEIPAWLTS